MKKILIVLAILLSFVPLANAQALLAGQTKAQVNTFLSPYTGTFNGSLITGTYGGTGVNNGSSTITIGGNLTLSGAFTTTLTVTGNTSVTLPTTGMLVNTAVTTLSSLVSVSTITTGVWNGTDIAVADGGTGVGTFTTYAPLVGGTTSTGALQQATTGMSTSGNVLTSTGASSLPTWQASSSIPTSAITADQTAAVNTAYVINKVTTRCVLTMPASAAVGDKILVRGGSDVGGWRLAGITSLIFHASGTTSVTGTGAFIDSGNQWDAVEIICIVANTEWIIATSTGQLTIN